MGTDELPRVLVDVEPALLGELLVEILDAVGEDEVTNLPAAVVPATAVPYSVALVSEPMRGDAIAEVVIVLPGAGQSVAQVHTSTGTLPFDMRGPLALLQALDRFCPSRGRRATAASDWQAIDHGSAAS